MDTNRKPCQNRDNLLRTLGQANSRRNPRMPALLFHLGFNPDIHLSQK